VTVKITNRLPMTIANLTLKAGKAGDAVRLDAMGIGPARSATAGIPAASAVKVDGERAYKLARRGEEPRPRAREVEIYETRLLDFAPGAEAVARIEVRCGSGTYLRSIARDLGRRLGVGGYLGRLVRTAYGGLAIDAAAQNRLDKSRLKSNYVLFLEDVTAEELARGHVRQLRHEGVPGADRDPLGGELLHSTVSRSRASQRCRMRTRTRRPRVTRNGRTQRISTSPRVPTRGDGCPSSTSS